jgi:hypothetical protein
VTTLDERDRLLRQTAPLAELALGQPGSTTQRPQDPANSDVVHAARIASGALLAITWGLTAVVGFGHTTDVGRSTD